VARGDREGVHAGGGRAAAEGCGLPAIILDGWKLVHNTGRAAGRPEYELYDHRKDPLDRIDVAARQPEVVERLAHALKTWRSSADSARLKPDAVSTHGLSDEELQRLRSLGYIQ